MIKKILKIFIVLLFVMLTLKSAFALQQEFNFTKTNDTIVIFNDYNTKVLTTSSGKFNLTFEYDCENADTLNKTLQGFKDTLKFFNQTKTNFTKGIICNVSESSAIDSIAKKVSTQMVDNFDGLEMLTQDLKNDASVCFGYAGQIAEYERTKVECNMTRDTYSTQINFKQQQINDLEKQLNNMQWFLVIVVVVVIVIITAFARGVSFSSINRK